LRGWFERDFTFKGVALFAIWIAKLVPDAFGRTGFLATNAKWIWGCIYGHETAAVTIVCALLIWLDHTRVLSGREPKPHDERTLKGRTLRLRDDLKRFAAEVGKKPEVHKAQQERMQEYMKRSMTAIAPWMNKIMFGYELRFKDAVYRVHLEYGEQNLLPGIGINLPDHVSSDGDLQAIIDKLDGLIVTLPS
jgi:hypothetical protein